MPDTTPAVADWDRLTSEQLRQLILDRIERNPRNLWLRAAYDLGHTDGRAEEREACARLAEEHQAAMDCWRATDCPIDCEPHALMSFADVIRARQP